MKTNNHKKPAVTSPTSECELQDPAAPASASTTRKSRRKKEPEKCNLCGKYYIYLASHIRVHTGEMPFKCPTCPKEFNQSGHLSKHKASCKSQLSTRKRSKGQVKRRKNSMSTSKVIQSKHQQGGRTCNICGKVMYQSLYHFQVHQRSHTGEKPYECPTCYKRFAAKYYLRLHERIHTDDRKFQCSLCEMKFVQWNQLDLHKKTHHLPVTRSRQRKKLKKGLP